VHNRKQHIAIHIKNGRLAKGYTLLELAALSDIPVRTIERIEKGELLPGKYTRNLLYAIVAAPMERVNASYDAILPANTLHHSGNKKKFASPFLQIALRIACTAILVFMAFIFFTKTSGFRESALELFAFRIFILFLLTGLLLLIWRTKKINSL
jgi:transcriptional regulator with XRE-family HTH domain